MRHMMRPTLAALFACSLATGALAGASSTPTGYQPDPALRTASMTELSARIRRACTVTQAKIQNASEASFSGPCGCYASRTLRALSSDELQAYRDTGVFNDSARLKALAAIDACRLQRPI